MGENSTIKHNENLHDTWGCHTMQGPLISLCMIRPSVDLVCCVYLQCFWGAIGSAHKGVLWLIVSPNKGPVSLVSW